MLFIFVRIDPCLVFLLLILLVFISVWQKWMTFYSPPPPAFPATNRIRKAYLLRTSKWKWNHKKKWKILFRLCQAMKAYDVPQKSNLHIFSKKAVAFVSIFRNVAPHFEGLCHRKRFIEKYPFSNWLRVLTFRAAPKIYCFDILTRLPVLKDSRVTIFFNRYPRKFPNWNWIWIENENGIMVKFVANSNAWENRWYQKVPHSKWI